MPQSRSDRLPRQAAPQTTALRVQGGGEREQVRRSLLGDPPAKPLAEKLSMVPRPTGRRRARTWGPRSRSVKLSLKRGGSQAKHCTCYTHAAAHIPLLVGTDSIKPMRRMRGRLPNWPLCLRARWFSCEIALPHKGQRVDSGARPPYCTARKAPKLPQDRKLPTRTAANRRNRWLLRGCGWW